MFDHVGVSVSDRAASRRFYDTVLAPLGHRLTHQTEHFDEWDDFGTAQADAERPVTTGLHVAFVAGRSTPARLATPTGTSRSGGASGPREVVSRALGSRPR